MTGGQIATVEAQRAALAADPEDIAAREGLAGYEAALGGARPPGSISSMSSPCAGPVPG